VTIWLAILLLTASVALFVAAPLTEVFAARRETADATARFEHERGLALAAIRELEFDHAMGKIADSEFQTLRARLEDRALTAMMALDGLSESPR
jgi:cytochrome c-type biogenesis protein CcmH/NrfG